MWQLQYQFPWLQQIFRAHVRIKLRVVGVQGFKHNHPTDTQRLFDLADQIPLQIITIDHDIEFGLWQRVISQISQNRRQG